MWNGVAVVLQIEGRGDHHRWFHVYSAPPFHLHSSSPLGHLPQHLVPQDMLQQVLAVSHHCRKLFHPLERKVLS